MLVPNGMDADAVRRAVADGDERRRLNLAGRGQLGSPWRGWHREHCPERRRLVRADHDLRQGRSDCSWPGCMCDSFEERR